MKKNRIATRMGSTISLFTYFYNLNFNLQYNFPLPLLAIIILEQESLIKIFAVGHEYMITLEKKGGERRCMAIWQQNLWRRSRGFYSL
jgi:hypothetical protein